jgi:carbon storage regulator
MKDALLIHRIRDGAGSELDPPARTLTQEERVMLILSRKLGQGFHVGEGVRITVVKIDNNSIRIGIDAPDHVSIQRSEIAFELPSTAEQPAKV